MPGSEAHGYKHREEIRGRKERQRQTEPVHTLFDNDTHMVILKWKEDRAQGRMSRHSWVLQCLLSTLDAQHKRLSPSLHFAYISTTPRYPDAICYTPPLFSTYTVGSLVHTLPTLLPLIMSLHNLCEAAATHNHISPPPISSSLTPLQPQTFLRHPRSSVAPDTTNQPYVMDPDSSASPSIESTPGPTSSPTPGPVVARRKATRGRKLGHLDPESIADLPLHEQEQVLQHSRKYQQKAAALVSPNNTARYKD